MIRRLAMEKRTLHAPFQSTKLVQEPLTETDILELQDVFLTNGLHVITVHDVAAGRKLVTTFLHSLHCFHDIACLSIHDADFGEDATNLYNVLIAENYLDYIDIPKLEDFFFEKFYFDFVWIEATNDLQAMGWFVEFKSKLVELSLHQHVPIIYLSYQNVI